MADSPDVKCVGVSEAAQSFVALGTLVDLATQTYAVPSATGELPVAGATGNGNVRPDAPRHLSTAHGTPAGWGPRGGSGQKPHRLLVESATRIRTWAMDTVIMSRPDARAPGLTRRARRRVWDAAVLLTDACREELAWWADNLRRMGTRPIRETPSALPSIAQSRATRVTRASGLSRTSMGPRRWPPRWSPPSAPWRLWA